MKRVVVTGANGFIGSTLVKELISKNIEVLAIVKNNNYNRLPKDRLLKIISLDLSEISNLKDKVEKDYYDTFYHFAWAGSSGLLRMDERLQLQNALWTSDSLRVAKEIGCGRFVCAGSIMEKEATIAIHEQGSKPGMAYIYGVGKMTAHCISKPIANEIGIELIWAIITNAYGEGEISPRFINTTIRKMINKDTLKFTSAIQNYDFIHVSDVAKAFYYIGEKGKANCEYLIGGSNAKPLKEYIIELQQEIAPQAELIFGDVPFTGINLPLSAFDTSAIEQDTGFRAEISFKEGVRRTMEWFISSEGNTNDAEI